MVAWGYFNAVVGGGARVGVGWGEGRRGSAGFLAAEADGAVSQRSGRFANRPYWGGGSGVKGSAPPQGDRPVAPTGIWLFSCRSGGGGGGWLWVCGWRWKTPGGRCPCHTAQSDSAAPIAIQWGFGRPGTVGRYRPAALKCSTHHGPIRAGCPGWLLRGWLHCAKASRAPGPAVGAVQA